MAASFVKALSFASGSGGVSVTSSSGHQAGDVAIVWVSSRGNNPDPSLNAGSSTYTPANLTTLPSVNCSILGSSRVKVRAFIYEIPDSGSFTLAFTDTGAMNAASGVIYRGIDVPSAYIADTDGQDNIGTAISIPAGTVTSGSLVLGIFASGADTTSSVISSFSGSNLTGVTIRASGHGNVSSGIGHYTVEGTASATSVGPITGTASISDYWGAASIELVPSSSGVTVDVGTVDVHVDTFAATVDAAVTVGVGTVDVHVDTLSASISGALAVDVGVADVHVQTYAASVVSGADIGVQTADVHVQTYAATVLGAQIINVGVADVHIQTYAASILSGADVDVGVADVHVQTYAATVLGAMVLDAGIVDIHIHSYRATVPVSAGVAAGRTAFPRASGNKAVHTENNRVRLMSDHNNVRILR